MFKLLCLAALCVAGFGAQGELLPIPSDDVVLVTSTSRSNLWDKWKHWLELLEFAKLIDVKALLDVVFHNIYDIEVLRFIAFVLSPKFKEIIWNFESIEEFKEATSFLASKGYDVERIIDVLNSILKLPPYQMPEVIARRGAGITGFIEAIINTLPLEDMKKLLQQKLETNPEFLELFKTLNSKEFLAIMKKLSKNPEFTKIKLIFEDRGIDFKRLCHLLKEVLGEHYQGVFCHQ